MNEDLYNDNEESPYLIIAFLLMPFTIIDYLINGKGK